MIKLSSSSSTISADESLLLKFINCVINDVSFLVDEALSKLQQLQESAQQRADPQRSMQMSAVC